MIEKASARKLNEINDLLFQSIENVNIRQRSPDKNTLNIQQSSNFEDSVSKISKQDKDEVVSNFYKNKK